MRRALLIAAAGLLLACGGGSFGNEERAEITQVLEEQRSAWNRGDIEAFMEGYENTPDIVFTSGAKVRRGWDETLARYKARYVDKEGMGKLRFSEVEITGLDGDSAIVLGRYTLEDTPNAGTGIFTLVVRRGDDGWRVLHDHTSAEPKPEPAAQPADDPEPADAKRPETPPPQPAP